MAAKNIIAAGIGFSPGSVKFMPTRGLTPSLPVVTLQIVNGLFLFGLKGFNFNFLSGVRNIPASDLCTYQPSLSVPAVDTLLPVGPIPQVYLAYFNNLDLVNVITVKNGIGGTILAKVAPKQSQFFQPTPAQIVAGLTLAVTASGSPNLEYHLWGPP